MVNTKLIGLIALLGIIVISYGLFNILTSDYETPDMKGYIINISNTEQMDNDVNGLILVEGIMRDNQSIKVSVTINKKTHLFIKQNNENHPITFAELKKGQNVEIKFTGPILESYPAQATADRIVVLE